MILLEYPNKLILYVADPEKIFQRTLKVGSLHVVSVLFNDVWYLSYYIMRGICLISVLSYYVWYMSYHIMCGICIIL